MHLPEVKSHNLTFLSSPQLERLDRLVVRSTRLFSKNKSIGRHELEVVDDAVVGRNGDQQLARAHIPQHKVLVRAAHELDVALRRGRGARHSLCGGGGGWGARCAPSARILLELVNVGVFLVDDLLLLGEYFAFGLVGQLLFHDELLVVEHLDECRVDVVYLCYVAQLSLSSFSIFLFTLSRLEIEFTVKTSFTFMI